MTEIIYIIRELIVSEKIMSILSLAFFAGVFNCSNDPLNPHLYPSPPLSEYEQMIVESNNKFGITLFKEVSKQMNWNDNVMLSPLTLSIALGTAFNGASGRTRDEFSWTLEYGNLNEVMINESYRNLIETIFWLDPIMEFNRLRAEFF